MFKALAYWVFICLIFLGGAVYAQNESNKWYFGNQAALDFMTSPPTIITTGAMSTSEGCASVANGAGNLLFYTDGSTVYNQANVAMANGTGLQGFSSSSQSGIIVKQPGNTNIYYVFTQGATINGLKYSIVDMSLAAGMGSVTTKNVPLSVPSSEKLTSVKHCNGVDVWVLTHDYMGNNFQAYLVSAGGVNATPVISAVGLPYAAGTDYIGCLKFSPNGKKLAVGLYGVLSGYEVYDFDASTGIITNPLYIGPGFSVAYGVEFSPDGTKLYGGRFGGMFVYQWDLCAPSVVASQYTVCSTGASKGQLQLASDGKIYIARSGQMALAVINDPNVAGAGCNYVEVGQSIAPKTNFLGLPNFITSGFKPPPPPFTNTVSLAYGCQTASFTAPAVVQNYSVTGCTASGYSLTGVMWDFGDPLTGAVNTSTLVNPAHAYSTLGTYTPQLVLYYSCGGGTDTIHGIVNINTPCITVIPSAITCANLGSATVTSAGVGPYSYTWMPGNQTGSVVTGLSPGTYTITVHDFGFNFTYTSSATFVSPIPLTGNLVNSSSVACYGAATGSAAIINLAGGSGNQNYLWSNGVTTYTTASPATLSAGFWSVTVTDALTSCQINQAFFITQPPAATLMLSSNVPSVCVGGSIALTGTNSGGSPSGTGSGYTYTWTGGPTSANYTVSPGTGGTYVYTLSSKDGNACTVSTVISVDFVNNPVISVSNVSICPLKTGTLSASGASSYTWTGGLTGSTFTDNPLSDQGYTVLGSALGCTATATASIILKAAPVPTLGSNSPLCNGQALQLSAAGATGYLWTGPPSFTSSVQSPTINAAVPANSGVYHATLTAANSCTAAQTINVTVNPTPTLSVGGSTVCVTQTLNLTASSIAGATYAWTGPNAFASSVQNPHIASPSTLATGPYTVVATSAAGCTNTAVAGASVVAVPVPSYVSNSPRCFGDDLIFNAGLTTGALSYAWSGPNSFTSSIQNPTVSNVPVAAAGIYTLVVVTGPCVVTYTSSAVIVNALPTLTVSATPTAVCEGKSTQLSAAGTATGYVWNGPSSFASGLALNTISPLTASSAGVYSVTATDVHGCRSLASVSIALLANPVVLASGTVVCTNDTARLSASGAASYSWQGPYAYSSLSQIAIIPVTISANVGTYTVIGAAANSCTDTATAYVNILPLPVPVINAVKQSLCVNDTLVLQGSNGLSYAWQGPLGFSSSGHSMKLKLFSPGCSGLYTLTVRDGGNCPGSVTQSITVRDLPQIFVNGATKGCVPFCTTISFQPNPLSAPLNGLAWQVNGRGYSGNSFSDCFNTAGRYLLSAGFSDIYACTNVFSDTIRVYTKPTADFSLLPETPVENTEPVIFTSALNSTYAHGWAVKDASVSKTYTAASVNMSYFFTVAGVYPVAMVVSNENGCRDTVIKLITVEPDFNIYVPNAFTPNSDGKNEQFMPVTRGISHLSFQVFDRWGQQLFSTTEPGKGWDGTYKGEECKPDTYAWQLSASDRTGQTKTAKGQVLLYR